MTKVIELSLKNGTIEEKISKLEAHKKVIEEKIDECKEALKEYKEKLAFEKQCAYIKLEYEKKCAEAELLSMCDGIGLDKGYYIGLLHSKMWYPGYFTGMVACPYRFASKESCQEAIEKLGDRRLKLVFNIPLEK